MPFEGAGKRRRRCRRIDEQLRKLFLGFTGQPQDFDIGNVLSNLRGKFRLDSGVMTFSSLTFNVPGAAVSLNGSYALKGGALNFTGKLRLDAKLSQTMTGFK